MRKPVFMLAIFLFAVCSPLVSADNQSETVSKDNVISVDPATIPTYERFFLQVIAFSPMFVDTIPIHHSRDCDEVHNGAPGEVWFKFVVRVERLAIK